MNERVTDFIMDNYRRYLEKELRSFQTIFLRSGKSLKLELPRNPKRIMNCQDMHVI